MLGLIDTNVATPIYRFGYEIRRPTVGEGNSECFCETRALGWRYGF